MIVYLDTSALVKLYIAEQHSSLLRVFVKEEAQVLGTSLIARPEFSASIAKGVRTGMIWKNVAALALERFRTEWQDLQILSLTEENIATADTLAWTYNMRGFDAIHLATALHWQDSLNLAVTLVTFDQRLWQAAQQLELLLWPPNLIELGI